MHTSHAAALQVSIEQLLEGVQIIGFDWTYLYLNETAARHGQRSRSDLLGRTMMECYPGIEATDVFGALQRVMRTRRAETVRNEFTYPTGDRAWFDLLIEPVPDGICVLSLDISDKHRLEQQFQQAQKMEAVGQLAGGVAHDFNNLLTVILGYCDLLLGELSATDPHRGFVDEIRKSGEDAASLTRQLLAFSRKQLIEPKILDLNAIITRTGKMLQRLIGEDIDLQMRLAPELGRVKADAGQISQVLTNLVVNARDAMPAGGKLTIETQNLHLDDHYGGTHLAVVPGPYVQLAVTDTGHGMSPDVQARIFEPFFTTKEVGRGTGLGLASVYGIVKQSGGNIWVYSELGHGTTFKVYLPRVDEVEPVVAVDATADMLDLTATVLVVEDNPALLHLITSVLQRHRFHVLSSGSAADALRISRTHDGPIDLLLTDIVMPEQSGPSLASDVMRERPEIRVIQMSGYSTEAVVRHGLLEGTITFLQKPFMPSDLVRKVRETLVQRQPG